MGKWNLVVFRAADLLVREDTASSPNLAVLGGEGRGLGKRGLSTRL